MSRKAKVVFILLFLIFFLGFIFSSMTLAFVNLPAEYRYEVTSYGKEKPGDVTLIVPIPYTGGETGGRAIFQSERHHNRNTLWKNA